MARLSILLISLFLLAAPAAGAEPIGRLFFSPEERAALDQVRHKGGHFMSTSGQVSVSGYVQRSSGKTTTWINQMPQHENEKPQGTAASGMPATAVPILLPSGKQVTLKPGQRFDPVKGEIREGYQDVPVAPPSETVK